MGKKRLSEEAKLNQKYLALYKSWEKIFSPALNRDVHFTNKGWQHIQQEKWRTRSEKEERLKLLAKAKHILGRSTFVQEKRLQNYKGTPHLHYRFTALLNNEPRAIGIVVIEDRGQLDFLSVFMV